MQLKLLLTKRNGSLVMHALEQRYFTLRTCHELDSWSDIIVPRDDAHFARVLGDIVAPIRRTLLCCSAAQVRHVLSVAVTGKLYNAIFNYLAPTGDGETFFNAICRVAERFMLVLRQHDALSADVATRDAVVDAVRRFVAMSCSYINRTWIKVKQSNGMPIQPIQTYFNDSLY